MVEDSSLGIYLTNNAMTLTQKIKCPQCRKGGAGGAGNHQPYNCTCDSALKQQIKEAGYVVCKPL